MTCPTLTMQDSFGDGWNGNYWHWVDASGGDTTGTLSSGSSGTAQLCFAGGSCHTFYVDTSGSYQGDVSWTVTDPAGSTVASVGTTTHLRRQLLLGLLLHCTDTDATPHCRVVLITSSTKSVRMLIAPLRAMGPRASNKPIINSVQHSNTERNA